MHRKNLKCSIQCHLSIRPARIDAYENLAGFHYRDKALGPYTHLFAVYDEHYRRKIMTPVAWGAKM